MCDFNMNDEMVIVSEPLGILNQAGANVNSEFSHITFADGFLNQLDRNCNIKQQFKPTDRAFTNKSQNNDRFAQIYQLDPELLETTP